MDPMFQQQDVASRPTRRVVVTAMVLAPVIALLAWSAGVMKRNARLLRPSAQGESSTQCAICGDSSHGMLLCPDNPRVI